MEVSQVKNCGTVALGWHCGTVSQVKNCGTVALGKHCGTEARGRIAGRRLGEEAEVENWRSPTANHTEIRRLSVDNSFVER